MAKYMVMCKIDAKPEELASVKQRLEGEGLIITHEFDSVVARGFGVEIPANKAPLIETYVKDLQADHEHIDYIEPDGEVRTQESLPEGKS